MGIDIVSFLAYQKYIKELFLAFSLKGDKSKITNWVKLKNEQLHRNVLSNEWSDARSQSIGSNV